MVRLPKGGVEMLGKKLASGRIGEAGWLEAGFTLIELLVTMAVAGILLTLAVPSFTTIINNNRLVSQTNELVAAIQLTRMEAVRTNSRGIVCRSTDGSTCAAATGAWTKWVSGTDSDRNGTIDKILRVGAVTTPLQVNASPNVALGEIVFHSDGMAYQSAGTLLNAGIGVCLPTTQPKENLRLIAIGAGSRISTTSSDVAGSCAAPISNTP